MTVGIMPDTAVEESFCAQGVRAYRSSGDTAVRGRGVVAGCYVKQKVKGVTAEGKSKKGKAPKVSELPTLHSSRACRSSAEKSMVEEEATAMFRVVGL